MMPEERQLLFERATGVDHAVEPIRLATLHVDEAVLVDVVAPDEVFVFQGRRRVLGVQKLFDSSFVALSGISLDLLPAGAESCAAKQVCHQCKVFFIHGTPLARLSGIADVPHYT